jgi:uroporphyrinogen decarboxylase
MTQQSAADGIHAMAPREKTTESARKLRDTYAITPDAPLFRREFGYMDGLLERWRSQGLPPGADFAEVFFYDPPGNHGLGGLGWCEAGFCPAFEVKVIEDRGEHEVYQDVSGRHVLVFKGRRSGFMPEYVDHPVKDMKTWQESCKWRMDARTPERWEKFDQSMAAARAAAGKGLMISQHVVGAYMYLRSLIGPMELLYAFYDMPEVIHDCMRTWLDLADAVITRHQRHVTLDEIFFGEDICYNHGPLISPEMMKEFLFPYYRQLIGNVRSRQIDTSRHLYVNIDTDGYAVPVIDLYREAIGMDVMDPFEAASGCDVVKVGRQYPDLVVFGGIDKRILAKGKDAIDRHLEYIIPAMRRRGGYIPTSDHAVPAEVSLENYMHYRRRCVELGG